MDHICSGKFGNRYDSEKGLVISTQESDYLKTPLAAIPEGRKKSPHIRFFLEKNPHYEQGDELVCIANLNQKNFKKETAGRVIGAVTVKWVV